jgi:hypothetical protein
MSTTCTHDTKRKNGQSASFSMPKPGKQAAAIPTGAFSPAAGYDFSRISIQAPSSQTKQTSTPCPIQSNPTHCPYGGACHTCPPLMQTKLAFSHPGDQYCPSIP